MDTLVGLMGEIKDIRHELNMNTPTAADGAENPEFGSAQIEAEESLPGPQFIASVDTGVETAVEDGVVVDSLEKKEGVGEEESQAAGEGAKGENGAAEETPENVPEAVAGATVVEDDEEEEKPAPPVAVEEERPAFTAAEVEQENTVPAKALCSCSIM